YFAVNDGDGLEHAPSGQWFSIAESNAVITFTGDQIAVGPFQPPFDPGDFTWPVKWMFKNSPSGSTGQEIEYMTATHRATCDATKVEIWKLDSGPYSKDHAEASSPY